MPTLTPEERVVAALSHEEPDRIPLYDLVDNRRVIEHFAGAPLTLENAAEVVPAGISRCLDTTRVWLPVQPGIRTDEQGFVHERRDWWNEWVIQRPFNDLPGVIRFIKDDIERLHAWQPSDPALELAQNLEWKRKFAPCTINAAEAYESLTDLAIRIGFDQFVYAEQEDPDLVETWIQANHHRLMRRLQSILTPRKISPICWIFGDMAYKNRLIFSPAYLRSHRVFHRIAEITSFFHNLDLKVIFHSDGFLLPVVPDLIAAGVDALAPIDSVAGLELGLLKERFGNQVAFVGGMNLNLLTHGTPEEIRRVTLAEIKAAGKGGGLILGSSSEELYEEVPAENILAFWQTVWDAGIYPLSD